MIKPLATTKRYRYLTYLLTEVVNSLVEQEQQPLPAPAAPPVQAAPAGGAMPPAADASATTDPNGQPIPLTIDQIIDKLNIIRGGTSFSEPEIYQKLTDLFNGTPEEQKPLIDGFLKSVGEVVAMKPEEAGQQVPGAQQMSPGSAQPSIPTAPPPSASPPAAPIAPVG